MIEQTAAVAAGGANSVRGQVQARPCLLFHCRKEDLLQIVTRASARDFTVSCCLVNLCKLYNIFFRSGKVPPFPHSPPQSTAQAAKIRKWSTFSNSFQRNQHT